MSKVKIEQLRKRFSQFEEKRKYYEWKSNQPGKLKRHEMWRHEYLSHPYLLGSPDSRIADRFCNIFKNAMELNSKGQISLISMEETDEHMINFTHMLEEYESRSGSPPPSVVERARLPLIKYFESGTPSGVQLFEGFKAPEKPVLVKYGKREYLEPMFKEGRIRLANAGLYNDTNLIASIRDDEISRTFIIPTFAERLAGQTNIEFQGHRIDFNDDDITLPLKFNDYYLFSLCEHIHYRMPTDFEADAAIVINEPIKFTQTLISKFLQSHPNWRPLARKVTYYDPYQNYTKFKIPEMAKHFGYAYQKEFRIALLNPENGNFNLEPLHLKIGSMQDYSNLLYL